MTTHLSDTELLAELQQRWRHGSTERQSWWFKHIFAYTNLQEQKQLSREPSGQPISRDEYDLLLQYTMKDIAMALQDWSDEVIRAFVVHLKDSRESQLHLVNAPVHQMAEGLLNAIDAQPSTSDVSYAALRRWYDTGLAILHQRCCTVAVPLHIPTDLFDEDHHIYDMHELLAMTSIDGELQWAWVSQPQSVLVAGLREATRSYIQIKDGRTGRLIAAYEFHKQRRFGCAVYVEDPTHAGLWFKLIYAFGVLCRVEPNPTLPDYDAPFVVDHAEDLESHDADDVFLVDWLLRDCSMEIAQAFRDRLYRTSSLRLPRFMELIIRRLECVDDEYVQYWRTLVEAVMVSRVSGLQFPTALCSVDDVYHVGEAHMLPQLCEPDVGGHPVWQWAEVPNHRLVGTAIVDSVGTSVAVVMRDERGRAVMGYFSDSTTVTVHVRQGDAEWHSAEYRWGLLVETEVSERLLVDLQHMDCLFTEDRTDRTDRMNLRLPVVCGAMGGEGGADGELVCCSSSGELLVGGGRGSGGELVGADGGHSGVTVRC